MDVTQLRKLMHIKIKLLDEKLKHKYNDVVNHDTDCGFDVYMPQGMRLENQTLSNKVPLGIAVAAYTNKGYGVSCPFMLVPRSSISKTPFRMSNSIGIIDKDYRGELIAMVDNLQFYMGKVDENTTIKKGSRLFQIISFDGSPITYEIVDELDETIRGDGGFGSTGE